VNLASFILIPLIAGHSFAVTWAGSKYHAAREKGYRLYFRTALYGILLSAVASFLHLYLTESYSNYLPYLRDYIGAFTQHTQTVSQSDVALLSIGAITLVLGMTLGHLLNLIPYSKRFMLYLATENDDFERLVLRALRKLMPICVTMSNNKVYVGYVTGTIDPSVERTALRILPLLSGYRDKDDGSIFFNTSYHEVYERITANDNQPKISFVDDSETYEKSAEQLEREIREQLILDHLEIRDFEKILPFNEIRSSNLFDITAYQTFSLHTEDALQFIKPTPEIIEKAAMDLGTNKSLKELR
jgi:hypothetical protein